MSVSGIGPKTAVQMLTTVSVQELAIALVTGDTAALTRVPGIGKKTAQRLILELRERVDNDELPSGGFQAAAAADEPPQIAKLCRREGLRVGISQGAAQ